MVTQEICTIRSEQQTFEQVFATEVSFSILFKLILDINEIPL